MNDAAYAGLRRATRAQVASAQPDDETKPDPEISEEGGNEETDMTDTTNADALAEAKASGFAEANARMSTVLASEHYAGNEKLAATLLANDKLSADDITAALASVDPRGAGEAEASDNAAKAEDAARAEMREQIKQNAGGDAPSANDGKSKDKPEASSAVWDKALANIIPATSGAR